jgi:hypothetical protein
MIIKPELASEYDIHDLHNPILKLIKFACDQQTPHADNLLILALENFSFIAVSIDFVHKSDSVVGDVRGLVDEGGHFEDAVDLLEALGGAAEDAVRVIFQILSLLSLINLFFIFQHR